MEYIEPGQNVKAGFILKKNHSLECEMLEVNNKDFLKEEIQKNKDKEDFNKKCENVMNNSTIYDRKYFQKYL